MAKRRLEKQLAFRLKEKEKEQLQDYLKENDLQLQDIVRGYIINLLKNNDTPIFTTRI